MFSDTSRVLPAKSKVTLPKTLNPRNFVNLILPPNLIIVSLLLLIWLTSAINSPSVVAVNVWTSFFLTVIGPK